MTVIVAGNELHRHVGQGLVGHIFQVHPDHVAVVVRAIVVVIGIEAAGNLDRNDLTSRRQISTARSDDRIASTGGGNHAVVHRSNRLIAGGPGDIRQLHVPGNGVDFHFCGLANLHEKLRGVQPNRGDLAGGRNLILRLLQCQQAHQLVVRLVGLTGGRDVAEGRVGVRVAVGRVNGQKLRGVAAGLAVEVSPVNFSIGKGHGLGIVGTQLGAGMVLEGDGFAVLASDRLHGPGLPIHNKQVGAGAAVGIHDAIVGNGNVVGAHELMAVVFHHGQLAGQQVHRLQLNHGGATLPGHQIHGIRGVVKGHVHNRHTQIGDNSAVPQTGLHHQEVVARVHGKDLAAGIFRSSQSIGLQAVIGQGVNPCDVVRIGRLCKLDPAVHIVLNNALVVNAVGIQKILIQLGHVAIFRGNVSQLISALVSSKVTQTQLEFRTQAGDIKGDHPVPFLIGLEGRSFP